MRGLVIRWYQYLPQVLFWDKSLQLFLFLFFLLVTIAVGCDMLLGCFQLSSLWVENIGRSLKNLQRRNTLLTLISTWSNTLVWDQMKNQRRDVLLFRIFAAHYSVFWSNHEKIYCSWLRICNIRYGVTAFSTGKCV